MFFICIYVDDLIHTGNDGTMLENLKGPWWMKLIYLILES